jgi:hypothetical protein
VASDTETANKKGTIPGCETSQRRDPIGFS